MEHKFLPPHMHEEPHFVDILGKILGITVIFGTGIFPSAEEFLADRQDLSRFDQKTTAIKGGYIVLQN